MPSLQFMSNAVKWTAVGGEGVERGVKVRRQKLQILATKGVSAAAWAAVCLNKELLHALLWPVLAWRAISACQLELRQGSAAPRLEIATRHLPCRRGGRSARFQLGGLGALSPGPACQRILLLQVAIDDRLSPLGRSVHLHFEAQLVICARDDLPLSVDHRREQDIFPKFLALFANSELGCRYGLRVVVWNETVSTWSLRERS